jgi:diguanylate cyclase (GGDEF)-like protein
VIADREHARAPSASGDPHHGPAEPSSSTPERSNFFSALESRNGVPVPRARPEPAVEQPPAGPGTNGSPGHSDDRSVNGADEPVVDLRAPDPVLDLRSGATEESPNGPDRPATDGRPVDPWDQLPSRPQVAEAVTTGTAWWGSGSAPPADQVVNAEAGPESLRGAQSGLTRRLLVLVVAPLVPLLLASLLAIGLAVGESSGSGASADLAAAADDHRELRSALDRLWSGTLGLVAGGVGQQVATSGEVQALLGEARGIESSVSGPSDPAARRAFLDATERSLARASGDPLVLGNDLEELEELHRAAVEDVSSAALSLDDEAASELDSGSGTPLALGILLLGASVSAVSVLLIGRRLREQVDLPVGRLREAIRRVRAGEGSVRSNAGGARELADLGTEFDQLIGDLEEQTEALRLLAEWGEQSRLIFDAMDLADDEASLFDVVSRALGMVDAPRPAELLLADSGPNRLTVVATNPHAPAPGPSVDSAGACVALRRGQVAVFDDPGSLNACPILLQRVGAPISGACVPVTVGGRPAGVLHMVGPESIPPAQHVVERLVSLSSQIGNRLGSLRTLETTRQEASTDGLTGLPNRRSLEAQVSALLDRGMPFIMVLADLDKFKRLNDTYGHETGDRALQLFASVLRENVRGNDVVARLGGEEFVLVYPNMSVEISIEAIGRLRGALARAVTASSVPPFTCSFGITHSSVADHGDAILRIADAGLLRAKELGGDRAVVADAELASAVFERDASRADTDTSDRR